MRKMLFFLLLLAACSALVFAGGGKETGTGTTGAVTSAMQKEAPELAALVAEGKLPPLEQRLPTEPYVVQAGSLLPVTDAKVAIGKYGGTLRFASPGPDGGAEIGWTQSVSLLSNSPGIGLLTTEVEPFILKGYEVDPSGKVFTFHMREGMKWSDGAPVTTQDVLFWYQDVLLNKELTPVVPQWFSAGGEPGKLVAIDDYTFRVSFKEPYGQFLVRIGSHWFGTWSSMIYPKHFMKNYHIAYTDLETLKPKLREKSLEDNQWALLFNQVFNTGPRGTIGLPTLNPWMLSERPSPGVAVYKRNPYFWAVDTEGNQLPYIDGLRNEVVADSQMVLLKAMSGEIDLIAEAAVGADIPLLKENEQNGNYKVEMLHSYAEICYFFNPAYEDDAAWRQVMGNPKFRKALSYALSRKEVIRVVYNNFATEPEWTPAYDPETAKRMLDEIGLNKMDSEGWRLRPDGKRMEVNFDIWAVSTDWTKLAELATQYFNDIGIKTTMKVLDGGLYGSRADANQVQATTSWGHSTQLCISEPELIPALLTYAPRWPPKWNLWYQSNGTQGEEPSADGKHLYQMIDELRLIADPEERSQKILDIISFWHSMEFFLVPAEKAVDPWLHNADLGNVPTSGSRHAANTGAMIYYYTD